MHSLTLSLSLTFDTIHWTLTISLAATNLLLGASVIYFFLAYAKNNGRCSKQIQMHYH